MVISALVPSGLAEQAWVSYLTLVIVAVMAWVLAGKLGSKSAGEGLGYGLIFVMVAVLLDWLVSAQFVADISVSGASGPVMFCC